ncbi:MAG TPA: hypothetical protein VFD92_04575 [Candidatus Binatia bacterium]|nr:hypothetical protein [Candidatus Binatia bacterium]
MIGDFKALAASGGMGGFGSRLLAHGLNAEKALRANSPLLIDEQVVVDQRVIREFMPRLGVIARLIQNGQWTRLSNPFAVESLRHYTMSDTSGATLDRNPTKRTEGDLPDKTPVYTPVYYGFANFQLGIQELLTSRKGLLPLDLTLIGQKARDLAEAFEESVIRGTVGGVALPQWGSAVAKGILNAPNIHGVQYEGGKPWDDPTKTVAGILTDVKAMFAALDADFAYGAVDLLVPQAWFNALSFLTNTATDRTAMSFLKELERGGQPLHIQAADKLPANTALMYVRSSDVFEVVVGDFGGSADDPINAPDKNPVPITVFHWDEQAGLMLNFKLLGCVIPRAKATYGSKSGIAKLTA